MSQKQKATTLSSANFDEIISILDLCQKVALKYPKCDRAYEFAVKGMRVGLIKYQEKRLDDPTAAKLDAYLTWYMKTAIEFEMGIDNEDTQAWGNM